MIKQLGAAFLGLMLSACGGAGAPTPEPTSFETPAAQRSAPPSAPPSQSPTAIPTESARSLEPLAPDSIAKVIDGPLRIRSKPSTGTDSLKFPETLPTGEKVYIIEGPVRGSDYLWYLAAPVDTRWKMGWIPAGDHDGSPWLAPATLRCPTNLSIPSIATISPPARLFCLGSKAVAFSGTVQVPVLGCGDPSPSWSPGWFNPVCSSFWISDDPQDFDHEIEFFVPPDLPPFFEPSEDSEFLPADVVLAMDHEAAGDCIGSETLYPGDEEYPDFVHPDTFAFWCRTMFVASEAGLRGP